MKIRITKRDLELFGIQIVVWLVLMLVPAITTFVSTNNWTDTCKAMAYSMRITALPAGVYFVNFCLTLAVFPCQHPVSGGHCLALLLC